MPNVHCVPVHDLMEVVLCVHVEGKLSKTTQQLPRTLAFQGILHGVHGMCFFATFDCTLLVIAS